VCGPDASRHLSLIALAPVARRKVRALCAYYEERDRPQAARALRNALTAARDKIATSPAAGLPAPRPYKRLARPGRAWLKSGRYRIGYRIQPTTAIVPVFFQTANIPGRVSLGRPIHR
jgi:plasmid stabilization system protein ParE